MDELSLDSVLTFGKHQGKTIEEVIEKDSNYLLWALENDVIDLDSLAYKKLDEAIYGPDYEPEIYTYNIGDLFNG